MRYIKSFANDAAIQAAIDNKTLGKPYVALDDQLHRIDWNGKEIDPAYEYLTIKALESGNFYVRKSGISYSVNGGEWETTTGGTALSLNQGDAVRFKGTVGGGSLFSGNILAFNAYGNIESLEYGDDFKEVASVKNASGFTFCFSGCTGLIDASNLILPATSLSNYCYAYMFANCTNMIKQPLELPNSLLVSRAYYCMFMGCTSITKAPDILSTGTVVSYLMSDMFSGCTNLSYVKCLVNPYSLSASAPTQNWLAGVSETGTFVKEKNVKVGIGGWKQNANGIPSGWAVQDAQ